MSSLLPKKFITRFKNAEAEYKRLKEKIDKGHACEKDHKLFVEAKNDFFKECEKILCELYSNP